MNRFLKHWRLTRCNDTFHAHVVSYADDFVILSRGRAAEALARLIRERAPERLASVVQSADAA